MAIPGPSGVLYGTLHTACIREEPDECIVLVGIALRSRIGPHDLCVQMASALCRPGRDVLRMDCTGVGESEGSLPEMPMPEVYRAIQQGMFADDLRAGIDYVVRRRRPRHIVVGGVCTGANTSLFAAARDSRVDAVVLMGLWVLLTELPGTEDDTQLPEGEVDFNIRRYARNLCSLRGWLRLLTLRSNLRAILASLSAWLRTRLRGAPVSLHPRANVKALGAFAECMRRSTPVLVVFGDADVDIAHFRNEFSAKGMSADPSGQQPFDLVVIPQAGPTFVGKAATSAVIDAVRNWLEKLAFTGSDRSARRGPERAEGGLAL